MKKITLPLFLIATVFAFGQTSTDYVKILSTSKQNNNISQEAVISTVNGRLPVSDVFTTAVDFQAAVDENCSSTDFSFEDMSGGPEDGGECGETISSAGDDCYPAGEIQEGFTASTSLLFDDSNMSSLPPFFLDTANTLIGASLFADFTIIDFDPAVYAVSMEVYIDNNTNFFIRFFDTSGDLIEELNVEVPTALETFVGFLANEEIGRIELEGADGAGELFTNLSYGGVCTFLNVNEVSLQSLISLYPNPATDIVTINKTSDISIDSVTIFDTLGKSISLQLVNGQVNISALTSGVYFMNINTSRGSLTQKIIKK